MTAKKQKGINPDLEKAINKLMAQIMADPEASITDKVKILDRALKLEALKMKDDDAGWGTGFFTGNDDDDDDK
jgi:hypothetical protein